MPLLQKGNGSAMCVRTHEMALPEKPAPIEADLQEEEMSRLRQTYSREILCPPSTITFEDKQTPQFKMSWRVFVVQTGFGLDLFVRKLTGS